MQILTLKTTVTWLENSINTLLGPALAVSGIIAGVDLLTGGTLLEQQSWLSLTWAICLLLALDFQVLMLGVRARRIYSSSKSGKRKACELLAAVLIAAAISYVSVQMQSIIARSQTPLTTISSHGHQQTHSISIDQATRDMGINPITLIWERSTLVLVLIFMSGWLRDEEQSASATSKHQDQSATPLALDYHAIASAIAPLLPAPAIDYGQLAQATAPHISAIRTTIVEELRATITGPTPVPLLSTNVVSPLEEEASAGQDTQTQTWDRGRDTAPEDETEAGTPLDSKPGQRDNAERIAEYQARYPGATRRDIASALSLSVKTVSRYWKPDRDSQTEPIPALTRATHPNP